MSMSTISRTHLDGIHQAINNAFGDVDWRFIDTTERLGHSKIYNVAIDSNYYVIRIDEPRQIQNSLDKEYAVMQSAAKNQIAPPLYYTNPQNGFVIMKYINTQRLTTAELVIPERIKQFADFIKKLHQTTEFPKEQTVFEKLEMIYSQLDSNIKSSELLLQCMAIKRCLEKLFLDPADLRPSHGHINPRNLLFDGKRFWLVDWQSGSQQNFYFDLAACAHFFFFYNNFACNEFLKSYFGRTLEASEEEKCYLMRIFVSIYYGIIFIYLSSLYYQASLSTQIINTLPDYMRFMSLIGSGEEHLNDALTQQKFGFVLLRFAANESKTSKYLDLLEKLDL